MCSALHPTIRSIVSASQEPCLGCGQKLEVQDQFCGNCGKQNQQTHAQVRTSAAVWTAAKIPADPVPTDDTVPPLRRVMPDQANLYDTIRPAGAPPAQGVQAVLGPGNFFWHAPGRPTSDLSNNTRYLCAAPYVDPGFANKVIRNVLAAHRAVVPSVGFDLGPIIRHCLNARKLALIRDLVLTLLLLIGLVTDPFAVIILLVIAFLVGYVMPSARWHRRGVGGKIWAGLIISVVIVAIVILLVVEALGHFLANIFSFSALSGGGASASPSVGV